MNNAIKKDVIIIGNGISGVILANLLADKGYDLTLLGNELLGDGANNGDVIIHDNYYNLTVSCLHEIDGIVRHVLDKCDINIEDFARRLETVEGVLLNNHLVIRDKDLTLFTKKIRSMFPNEYDKTKDLLDICLKLKELSWQTFFPAKDKPYHLKMFMKYFKTSYKELVKSYNFSTDLENILMTIAPWEDISLIAMSSYWWGISSVARLDYGFKDLHRVLLESFLRRGGKYIAYVPIEHIYSLSENNYAIQLVDGRTFETNIITFTGSRESLHQYGLGRFRRDNPENRFETDVIFVKLDRKLAILSLPAYIRSRFLENGQYYRVHLSHLDKEVIKIDFIGDLEQISKTRFHQIIKKMLCDLGYTEDFEVVSWYSYHDISKITGVFGLNCWAHSVKELMSNPLGKLAVKKGIYCLGDWGSGYFYAAEAYSKEIDKTIINERERQSR